MVDVDDLADVVVLQNDLLACDQRRGAARLRAVGFLRTGGVSAGGDDMARAAALLLPRLAERHWNGRIPPVRFDAVLFDGDARPQWVRAAFSIDDGMVR